MNKKYLLLFITFITLLIIGILLVLQYGSDITVKNGNQYFTLSHTKRDFPQYLESVGIWDRSLIMKDGVIQSTGKLKKLQISMTSKEFSSIYGMSTKDNILLASAKGIMKNNVLYIEIYLSKELLNVKEKNPKYNISELVIYEINQVLIGGLYPSKSSEDRKKLSLDLQEGMIKNNPFIVTVKKR